MARERLVHRPFLKLGGRACRPPGARACVSLRAGLGGRQDARTRFVPWHVCECACTCVCVCLASLSPSRAEH